MKTLNLTGYIFLTVLLIFGIASGSYAQTPVADDFSVGLGTNLSVDVDILSLVDPQGGEIDTASIALTDLPDNGQAVIDTVNGIVAYTPDIDFEGTDSFTYTIANKGSGPSNPGLVFIAVSAQPHDSVDAPQGIPFEIDVVANDTVNTDTPPDPATVAIVTAPLNGAIENIDAATGAITYLSNFGFKGEDTFVYQVEDNIGNLAAVARVTLNVLTFPGAVDDSVKVPSTDPYTFRVLENDIAGDFPIDPGSVTIVDGPKNGTAFAPGDGRISYTSDFDYIGPDSLTYTMTDSDGHISNTATVFLDVVDGPAPETTNPGPGMLGENIPVTFDIPAHTDDFGLGINPGSIKTYDGPANGQITIDDATGIITYTPDTGFEGDDFFAYTIENNNGLASNEEFIFMGITGLVNDTATTEQGVPLQIDVTADDIELTETDVNFSDFIVDSSTVAIREAPQNGTITSVDTLGIVTYESDPAFTGTDTFIYEARRDSGGRVSVVASVMVEVIPFNELPVAVNDTVQAAINTSVNIFVLENDFDPEGQLDTTSVRIESAPVNGSAEIDTLNGIIQYTPNPGFTGSDSLSYFMRDVPGKFSNQAWVHLNVVDIPAPQASDIFVGGLGRDTPASFNIPANTEDFGEGLNLSSLTVIQSPANGQAVVDTDTGFITYTPDSGYEGDDLFTYTIENNAGIVSNEAGIILDAITGQVNDSVAVGQDTLVTIDVVSNDSLSTDFVPDPTTVAVVSGPQNGTITNIDTATGAVTYDPDDDFLGQDQFVYRVDTGSGEPAAIATVTITVTLPNQPPVAVDEQITTRINTPVLIDVLNNDSDPEGDPLTLESVTEPQNGIAEIQDNQVFYTPGMNFTGVDLFNYVVNDGQGRRDTAAVTVNVINIAFDITELELPDSDASRAFAVNDAGQVAGTYRDAQGRLKGFIWDNGAMTTIEIEGAGDVQILSLNESGTMAGAVEQNGIVQPLIWQNGTPILLNNFGGEIGSAYGISDSGTVVGVSLNAANRFRAFMWSNGTAAELNAPAGSSYLFRINNSGVAGGYVEPDGDTVQSISAVSGTMINFFPDTSGGETRSYGIGSSGELLGNVKRNGVSTAVIIENGVLTELPGLGGSFATAYAIDDNGMIAGTAGTNVVEAAPSASSHELVFPALTARRGKTGLDWLGRAKAKAIDYGLRAVVWIGSAVIDLNATIPNTGEWELLEARAVNSNGTIAGYGMLGETARAFVLTPGTNLIPKTSSSTVSITVNNPETINLLAYASDEDGDRLSLRHVAQPKNGSVTLQGAGTVQYRPRMNFTGKDTLNFTVTDGRGALAEGSLILEVVPLPARFALEQNYPNPFNPTTNIHYELPREAEVRLEVFDLLGRKVATLVDSRQLAGRYTFTFDGSGLASGLYLFRLQAGNFTKVHKMLLVK